MATSVTLGYNFRSVNLNSEDIVDLKETVKKIPLPTEHTVVPDPVVIDLSGFLTLAQFNEFKDAQVADRKWMVDALYNLHIKFDAFLLGYRNTVPPPDHKHPDGYDSTEIPMELNYVPR